MTQEFFCRRQCCHYYVRPYSGRPPYYSHRSPSYHGIRKAGSFVYDQEKRKMLLVQSRGLMWGPPKGSLNVGETPIQCAHREVHEETGLVLDLTEATPAIALSRSLFYLTEMTECPVQIQAHPNNLEANDANGIGWFSVDCVRRMVADGEFAINQPCRSLIQRVFQVDVEANDPFYSNRPRMLPSRMVPGAVESASEEDQKEDGDHP